MYTLDFSSNEDAIHARLHKFCFPLNKDNWGHVHTKHISTWHGWLMKIPWYFSYSRWEGRMLRCSLHFLCEDLCFSWSWWYIYSEKKTWETEILTDPSHHDNATHQVMFITQPCYVDKCMECPGWEPFHAFRELSFLLLGGTGSLYGDQQPFFGVGGVPALVAHTIIPTFITE